MNKMEVLNVREYGTILAQCDKTDVNGNKVVLESGQVLYFVNNIQMMNSGQK